MKTLSLFLLLTLLAAPGALAQPGEHETRAERGARMLDRRLEMLDTELTLSDAQEARIRRIFVAQYQRLRTRAEATRADADRRREALRLRETDPEAMRRHFEQERARMRAEWEATDRQVRAVLTRRQARRYTELRNEEVRRFEERMREHRPEHEDGRPGERTRVYVIRRPNSH